MSRVTLAGNWQPWPPEPDKKWRSWHIECMSGCEAKSKVIDFIFHIHMYAVNTDVISGKNHAPIKDVSKIFRIQTNWAWHNFGDTLCMRIILKSWNFFLNNRNRLYYMIKISYNLMIDLWIWAVKKKILII